jgi:hypothetical protein
MSNLFVTNLDGPKIPLPYAMWSFIYIFAVLSAPIALSVRSHAQAFDHADVTRLVPEKLQLALTDTELFNTGQRLPICSGPLPHYSGMGVALLRI